MNTTDIQTARRNYERAQQELNEAEAHAARYGEEPPMGTVISFVRRFGVKCYNYVAVRAEGGWYCTGRETTPCTWVNLNEFAEADTMRVATGWAVERESAADSRIQDEVANRVRYVVLIEVGEVKLTTGRPAVPRAQVKEQLWSGAEWTDVRVVKTFTGKDAAQRATRWSADKRDATITQS